MSDAGPITGGRAHGPFPMPGADTGRFSKALDALLGAAGGKAGSLKLLPSVMADNAPQPDPAQGAGLPLPLGGYALPRDLPSSQAQADAAVSAGMPLAEPDAAAVALPELAGLAGISVANALAAQPHPTQKQVGKGVEGLPPPAGLPATTAGERQFLPDLMPLAALAGGSESPSRKGLSDMLLQAGVGETHPADMEAADGALARTGQPASQMLVEPQMTLYGADRMRDTSSSLSPARQVFAMQLPLRAQGWDGEFSQRVLWMAGSRTQWAEITLNPPNLGNVEVRLSLNGNEAGAQFYSPHSSVRDAIDASLPRLRDMLAEAGITLGDTQVSAESFSERRGQGPATGYAGSRGTPQDSPEQPAVRAGRGLVDLFV